MIFLCEGAARTTAAAKEYRYDKFDSGKKDPFAVFGHGSGHCAGALRHRPQSGQQGALHDLTVSGHAMCDHLVVSGEVSARDSERSAAGTGYGSAAASGVDRGGRLSGQGAETGWCRGNLADLFQCRKPYYSHCDGHSGQGMGHLHQRISFGAAFSAVEPC